MRELNISEVTNVSGGYGEELVVASLLFGGIVTAGLIAASNPYPYGYSNYGYGYDVVVYDPYIYYDPYVYDVYYDPYGYDVVYYY